MANEPIPRLRPDLEIQPSDNGTVDVRDPHLLQVFTIPAEDFELARLFDGKQTAEELHAQLKRRNTRASRGRILQVAEELQDIFLLETEDVWKQSPVVENTAPWPQLEPTERKLRVLPVAQPDARWTCHACGSCCHGLAVEITSEEEARIDADLYRDLLEDKHFAVDAFIDPEQPAVRVLRQRKEDNEACVFLTDDGLCSVHARQGMEAKPDACQIFPHVVLQVPGQKPRLSLRLNCETMHETFEAGPQIQGEVKEVIRVLETSPSHRVPKKTQYLGRERSFAEVDERFDRLYAMLYEGGLTVENLDRIDRTLFRGRVGRARPRFGAGMLQYLEDEEHSRVPVEGGGYVQQIKRLTRGKEAFRAMQDGQPVPRVTSRVEKFLIGQMRNALYGCGPWNLPDAGYASIGLMLALEAMLHAIGPRGRLKTANTAFIVMSGPILEMTAHAWPVLESIDARHARRLRAEMGS
ncbi:MAG: YkgJ family cysteine cluster protein [Myxococcota bacterium]